MGMFTLPKIVGDAYTEGQAHMNPSTSLVDAAGSIVFGVAVGAAPAAAAHGARAAEAYRAVRAGDCSGNCSLCTPKKAVFCKRLVNRSS
jgi:predicted RecA/RadA family phage recombinase